MKPQERDHVHRRIVVEYGCLYAYVYMTDGNGKLLEEEPFRQPYRMDRKEVAEESREAYDLLWQHLSDTVNVTPLQEDGTDGSESDEED